MRVLRGVQKSICPVVPGASISQTSSILKATSLMEGSVASATTQLCVTRKNVISIFEESVRQQTAVFLGRGRYGHVFQLTSDSGVIALKISDDPVSLEAEFKLLCTYYSRLPENIVRPVPDSFVRHELLNWGVPTCLGSYKMAEVGSQLPRGRARDCFLSLYALHVGGIVHGDPRLQNVIYYDDRIKWIDVCPTEHFSATEVFEDVRIIVKSFFSLELSEVAHLDELAYLYSSDISRVAITTVYDACKQAKT